MTNDVPDIDLGSNIHNDTKDNAEHLVMSSLQPLGVLKYKGTISAIKYIRWIFTFANMY